MKQISCRWLVEKSVLTKNVLQRKFTKKSVQKCKLGNIVFSVKAVTKITFLVIFVSSVSKSTPTKSRMTKI